MEDGMLHFHEFLRREMGGERCKLNRARSPIGLDGPMFTTLVSPAELAAHIADPQWIVFDCRFDLADTGTAPRLFAIAYSGRPLCCISTRTSRPRPANGRHPLPDPDKIRTRNRPAWLKQGMQAVAYDAAGGYYAARLWWMLRWVGHASGAVLDGGWKAWLEAGLPVAAQFRSSQPAISAVPPERSRWTRDSRPIGQAGDLVVDARSPSVFGAKTRRSIQSAATYRCAQPVLQRQSRRRWTL